MKENTANTETCDVMQVDVETGSSSATVTDDTGLYSSPLESNMEGDDEEKQSKKDKIPLTPSMASPASPALSTGRYVRNSKKLSCYSNSSRIWNIVSFNTISMKTHLAIDVMNLNIFLRLWN